MLLILGDDQTSEYTNNVILVLIGSGTLVIPTEQLQESGSCLAGRNGQRFSRMARERKSSTLARPSPAAPQRKWVSPDSPSWSFQGTCQDKTGWACPTAGGPSGHKTFNDYPAGRDVEASNSEVCQSAVVWRRRRS